MSCVKFLLKGQERHDESREGIKMLRAAIHNAQNGATVENALELEQLLGHAAFVYAAQPDLGREMLDALQELIQDS